MSGFVPPAVTVPVIPGNPAATVINAGSLGATPSISLGGAPVVQIVGTLTANCALTLTGLSAGCNATLLLTEDATGGRTLTVNGVTITLPATTAGAVNVVQCWSPDGATLYATPSAVSTPVPSTGLIILGDHTGFAAASQTAAFITGLGGQPGASLYEQYSNATQTTWAAQLNNSGSGQDWGAWPGPKCYALAMAIAGAPLNWTSITSGANDSYFNTVFTNLKTYGVPHIRLAWEFNQVDTVYPWGVRNNDTGANQTGFKAAWVHIWGLANAIAPGFFKFWWNFSNGVNAPLTDIFTNYYPGDAYVDVVGMDIYIHTPSAWPGDATFLTELTTGNDPNWNDMVSFCSAHGLILAVPEFGPQPLSSTSPGDDATSTTNVCNLVSTAAAGGATVYFCPYNGGNVYASNYPNSYAALQTWVAAQVAAGLIA